MVCPVCGNTDIAYFITDFNRQLCRKCIMFQTKKYDEWVIDSSKETEYHLDFELSSYQNEISSQLKTLSENSDVLVYAACGTGKTEIIMETISYRLGIGHKVILAIPRAQVVVEIAQRMQEAFKDLTITAVYGGSTETLTGDLIVCTTHQLYRYDHYADLLIIDEPDAFPYRNNAMLEYFAKRACKGQTVYLTATPTKSLMKLETITLFKRFHGHPLLVPQVYVSIKVCCYLYAISWLKKHPRTIIFVPSKRIAKKLGKLFGVEYITSQTLEKESIINDFRKGLKDYLIATTILERGVTFSNVNIMVLFAEHHSFDLASLIQISGRVGRDPKHPTGEGIFICTKKSRKVHECINRLIKMNA